MIKEELAHRALINSRVDRVQFLQDVYSWLEDKYCKKISGCVVGGGYEIDIMGLKSDIISHFGDRAIKYYKEVECY